MCVCVCVCADSSDIAYDDINETLCLRRAVLPTKKMTCFVRLEKQIHPGEDLLPHFSDTTVAAIDDSYSSEKK